MITLEDYAMGRDKDFPTEWKDAKFNAISLLTAVNSLLSELGIEAELSSGFRPSEINSLTRNAVKNSLHKSGKAIDLKDELGKLKNLFTPLTNPKHAEMLRVRRLFMEHPHYTLKWMHLDQGRRMDRPTRVFIP